MPPVVPIIASRLLAQSMGIRYVQMQAIFPRFTLSRHYMIFEDWDGVSVYNPQITRVVPTSETVVRATRAYTTSVIDGWESLRFTNAFEVLNSLLAIPKAGVLGIPKAGVSVYPTLTVSQLGQGQMSSITSIAGGKVGLKALGGAFGHKLLLVVAIGVVLWNYVSLRRRRRQMGV